MLAFARPFAAGQRAAPRAEWLVVFAILCVSAARSDRSAQPHAPPLTMLLAALLLALPRVALALVVLPIGRAPRAATAGAGAAAQESWRQKGRRDAHSETARAATVNWEISGREGCGCCCS